MTRRVAGYSNLRGGRLIIAALRALVVGLLLPASFTVTGAVELLGEAPAASTKEEIVTSVTVPTRTANPRDARAGGSPRAVKAEAITRSNHGASNLSRILDHKSIDHRNSIGAALRL